jgi:FMN phosphatase YigB (HAD superfamily)
MIKAIFFDFGGTIAMLEPSFTGFLHKFIILAGGKVSPRAINDASSNFDLRYSEQYPANDEEELKRFWIEYYADVLQACKAKERKAQMVAEEMWNEHFKPDSYRIFPDVVPCLKQLSNERFELGILSNFDQSLREKIKCFAIEKHFRHIYISMGLAFQNRIPKHFYSFVIN